MSPQPEFPACLSWPSLSPLSPDLVMSLYRIGISVQRNLFFFVVIVPYVGDVAVLNIYEFSKLAYIALREKILTYH